MCVGRLFSLLQIFSISRQKLWDFFVSTLQNIDSPSQLRLYLEAASVVPENWVTRTDIFRFLSFNFTFILKYCLKWTKPSYFKQKLSIFTCFFPIQWNLIIFSDHARELWTRKKVCYFLIDSFFVPKLKIDCNGGRKCNLVIRFILFLENTLKVNSDKVITRKYWIESCLVNIIHIKYQILQHFTRNLVKL